MTAICQLSPVLAEEFQATASRPLVVGKIQIRSDDIYSDQEVQQAHGMMAFVRKAMNKLNMDTRRYVLRKELLFAAGDPYDPAKLSETERNLRQLGFLNNIKVAATDTTADGQVNITVYTQESWTLQSSFSFARGSGGDARWSVKLSDKNFLGHGLTLGAGVGSDENSSYWNAWLRKRRFTRHNLLIGFDYSDRQDGHYRNFFLSRPFYSEGDSWSAEISAWESLNDARYYLSNAGPAGADPGRKESLYARIPALRTGAQVVFQKRVSPVGGRKIWRLGAGLRLTRQDIRVDEQGQWLLSDGRSADLNFLTPVDDPLRRDQGTMLYPFVWLRLLGRDWVKARFVVQYGPVEDIHLNWSASLMTGPNGPNMGSTSGLGGNSWLSEFKASRWWRLGPGLGNLSGSAYWQAGGARTRYHVYTLTAGWVARQGQENQPWITRIFAEYAGGDNLAGNQALLLGLSRGLRTLDFDGRAGDRLARWNIEQGKVLPYELLGMFRLGAAVFYDGGNAWWRGEDRDLSGARHEMGCGLRLGPTRSGSAQVSRFDMSWALDGSVGPVFTASTRGFF